MCIGQFPFTSNDYGHDYDYDSDSFVKLGFNKTFSLVEILHLVMLCSVHCS